TSPDTRLYGRLPYTGAPHAQPRRRDPPRGRAWRRVPPREHGRLRHDADPRQVRLPLRRADGGAAVLALPRRRGALRALVAPDAPRRPPAPRALGARGSV